MSFKSIKDLQHTIDISGKNLSKEILLFRGISDIDKYLYPKVEHLHDPFLFTQMHTIVDRIQEAIENEETILIYGDYDTDGITATAILYRYLSDLGASCTYFIPDRKKDGYGLDIDVFEEILDENTSLVITVDCGITALEEIEFLNDLAIDSIITDHHTPLDELPDAFGILCPLVENSGYPFKDLSGAGIAFKLIHALSIRFNRSADYLKYIELAALGTIADIVLMRDENRTIAKIGMDLLSKTNNLGIQSLLEVSYPNGIGKINSSQLLFNIIPKLNASGRLDNAKHSIELLLSDDKQVCINLANRLNGLNEERKSLQKESIINLFNHIDKDKASISTNEDASIELVELDNIIVQYGEGKLWDRGILGIVASSVTEKYNRPSILLELEDDLLKGSARSVAEFDIIQAISSCSDILESYGGHKMAAGLSIKIENIDEFINRINEYAQNIDYSPTEIRTIMPDYIISFDDINLNNAQLLSCMEPYGVGNESSSFYISSLKLQSMDRLGKNKEHTRIWFEQNNKRISCIFFNSLKYQKLLLAGMHYDVVVKLSLNTVNNLSNPKLPPKQYINCEIQSIHFAKEPKTDINHLLSYAATERNIDRSKLAKAYTIIKSKGVSYKYVLKDMKDPAFFMICLDILSELAIIKYTNVNFEYIYLTNINDSKRRDLNNSETFIKANNYGKN